MGLLDAPPTPLIRRGVNTGYAQSIMTEAQRLAITPAVGDVILTSDNLAYWVGNGMTVGGVSSATGLTDEQAVRLGIIAPRHHDFLSGFRGASAGFKPFAVGNSIVQGTGASGSSTNWLYRLAVLMQSKNNVGVTNDWTAVNTGVGGSQILVPLLYASDYLTAAGVAQAPAARMAGRFQLGLIMTMRNDTNTSAGTWNVRIRALVRNMLKLCEDVVIVTEPPQLDSTGAPAAGEYAGWATIYRVAQEVAADYQVTLVDVWKKWFLEWQAGADLTTRMAETSGTRTHPNDDGHRMIGDLVWQALLMPATPKVATRDRFSTPQAAVATSIAAFAPVAATVGLTTLTGHASGYTAKGREVGSSSYYGLTTGQTATYDLPLPIYLLRPIVEQGNSAGGSISVDGTSLGTFSASAGSALELPATTVAPSGTTPGRVVVTGTTATALRLFGVQAECPEALDQHPTWAGATESGTWSGATFAAVGAGSGAAVRSSSTVADYIDITWYGFFLCFAIETGADRGKLTETTDGGSATTHDAYVASGTGYLFRSTPKQAVGWHTTRLQLATKNASASSNLVAVGNYKTCLPPDASTGYVTIAAGETMQLQGLWRIATVDRILSGSPFVSQWTPGVAALTVGGTGSAIVRLQR